MDDFASTARPTLPSSSLSEGPEEVDFPDKKGCRVAKATVLELEMLNYLID